MSNTSDLISAIVLGVTALGGGGRFVWNKLQARFEHIEARLDECHEREAAGHEHKGVMLSVIELLWAEVKRIAPASAALNRADRLMEKLKQPLREGDEK